MPVQKTVYECSLCKSQESSESDAKECELSHIVRISEGQIVLDVDGNVKHFNLVPLPKHRNNDDDDDHWRELEHDLILGTRSG